MIYLTCPLEEYLSFSDDFKPSANIWLFELFHSVFEHIYISQEMLICADITNSLRISLVLPSLFCFYSYYVSNMVSGGRGAWSAGGPAHHRHVGI